MAKRKKENAGFLVPFVQRMSRLMQLNVITVIIGLMLFVRVFPRPFTHGGICPPPYGGDKVLMGGTHEEGHRPYGGGPNFDRLYHKLKVLFVLTCNYTMQFMILLKLVDLYLIAFKFAQ